MRAALPLSLAVLAVAAYALPAPEPYLGLVALDKMKIADLDSEENCLSDAAKAISAENRMSLNNIATTLQMSLFRDIRQFAPAALAIGQPKIQEEILSNDFSASIAALHQLKSYIETNIPEVQETAAKAGSSSASEASESSKDEVNASSSPVTCTSPTAKNLRIIYEDLVKLAKQFQ
ncbi:hypothetical protein GGH96_003559 [Coemansia sp. RSA 1972]|nr:hypothetical protein GGH96_003559 [Coemansia sp. RSA 1972]